MEKITNLVMHMLVLFANTGASMDLCQRGHSIALMGKMFAKAAYTPCIEEHNIHAIFRWDRFLDIFDEYKAHQAKSGRVSGLFIDLVLPSNTCAMNFLENTGLTLSITTLGTCIYRVGTKRIKYEDTPEIEYNDSTEQFIFDACRYIHNVIVS